MTKTIKYLAMLAFAGLVVFTGCKDDDPDPIIPDGPVVTFSGVEGTALAVNFAEKENHMFDVSFTVEVDVPGGVADFHMVRKALKGDVEVDEDLFDYKPGNLNKTTLSYPFTGVLDFYHFVNDDYDKIQYQFIVIDNNDKVGELIFTVTDATVFPQSKEGKFYHIEGPAHGAYNLDGDATVGADGEAALKSMINTDAQGVAFTGKWTTGNNTLFHKVNYNFNAGLVREARLMFNEANAVTAVDAPAVNDVFIAKKGDIYYVVKITAVTPGAIPPGGTESTVNKGEIQFSYKKY
ncbi:MAG: hypothetical protein RBT74_05795 [Tenuifilaceae bacterium]|jgi:hypothetical protein|nr:hypothetical protein [Tenuifilaceae bacterium]